MIHLHERWKHEKSGMIYKIVTTGNNEADLTPVVVYQCETTGGTWVRSMAEFFDGRFSPVMPAKGGTPKTFPMNFPPDSFHPKVIV